ncbi:hypothetical protein D9M68_1003280 [compost metagenome]
MRSCKEGTVPGSNCSIAPRLSVLGAALESSAREMNLLAMLSTPEQIAYFLHFAS